MLYAGFDIGMKNLAFCVIDAQEWKEYREGQREDPGIKLWKNLNLFGEPETCGQLLKSGKQRGKPCTKRAKWCSKARQSYYCGAHKTEGCVKYTLTKPKNFGLGSIEQRAFEALDQIQIFNEVSSIAIESQPRINQQMKMFATAIEAYFVIRQGIDAQNEGLKIRWSPAKNKLKLYQGPRIATGHLKNNYDKRKYLAQKHVEYFLQRSPEVLRRDYYCSKKRDDLADAFLHCVYSIGVV